VATIPVGTVVAWRGNEPGPVELLLRGILAFCSFGVGLIPYLWIIARLGRTPWTSRNRLSRRRFWSPGL